ncbi:hypothetical protein AB0B45_33355 [Nonomuraea sp. NPDC049152]|uniref:hypothetical protein n=1 Tax=Nonomuraea sp. NPDC049152 TaxID=3154350 RepID=UPI003405703D
MTTFASPTLGACQAALWRVESHTLTSDTLVIPADTAALQVRSNPQAGFTAIVTAPAGSRAYAPPTEQAERIAPAWIR